MLATRCVTAAPLSSRRPNVELDGRYGFSKPAQPPAGSYVRLGVSDTGCGMDDEVKAHIFEPFFTTRESDGGTGLGLATVYSIVKRAGGYVWVYSEPQRGTTMKIYLPATGTPLAQASTPLREHRGNVPEGAETVLLVEDDENVRRVSRAVLHAHGYACSKRARAMRADGSQPSGRTNLTSFSPTS